jgi:hypothetical protein
MTKTVDSAPAADLLDPVLGLLEDQLFESSEWVDAEFAAIIAANWDQEPPEPPGQPTGLPYRWTSPRRPRWPRCCARLADQVMADDHHRRQRSPP